MSQASFQRQISLFCCHPLCFSKNNPKSRIQEQFLGQDHQNGNKHSVTYQLSSSRLTSKIQSYRALVLYLSPMFLSSSLGQREITHSHCRGRVFLNTCFPPHQKRGRGENYESSVLWSCFQINHQINFYVFTYVFGFIVKM